MNKKFFCTIFFACLLCSCTSDDANLNNLSNGDSYGDLLVKIHHYNDSLMLSHSTIQSKAGSGWGHTVAVAAADIRGAWKTGRAGAGIGSLFGPHGATIGGAIGGLIGGAGASYIAHQGLTVVEGWAESILAEEVTRAYSMISEDGRSSAPGLEKLPDVYKEATEMGVKHNKILGVLLDGEIIKDTSNNDYLSDTEYAVLNSPDYLKVYEEVQSEIISKAYLSSEIIDDSYIVEIVNLYLRLYLSYTSSLEDVYNITNEYVKLVLESDVIAEEDKYLFFSVMSVAVNSSEFWLDIYGESTLPQV